MESEDNSYMQLALAAAQQAADQGDVPVGAIIVCGEIVVGRGYNRREESQSPLGHAEIAALEQASRHFGTWRLSQCTIYVTLEPCIMCMGAMLQARIGRLVFGCLDAKAGAVESLYRLCEDYRLNHQIPATGGVLASEAAAMLAEFFQRLRERKRDAKKSGEVAEPG